MTIYIRKAIIDDLFYRENRRWRQITSSIVKVIFSIKESTLVTFSIEKPSLIEISRDNLSLMTFSIEKVITDNRLHRKSHHWLNFLREKIIIDDFFTEKNHHWWPFLREKSSLMTFEGKDITKKKSSLNRHIFNRHHRCSRITFFTEVITDDDFHTKSHHR